MSKGLCLFQQRLATFEVVLSELYLSYSRFI
jgi:hypothetical protein